MKTAMILCAITASTAAAERPNIVLMLADDQSWSGTSVAMHPDVAASKSDIYRTPNLERLAAQGMRFSAAYAPAPVCSPTRISIQTGKSPARLHWTKAAPPEDGRKLTEPRLVKSIASDEITIGERLRDAGYATAHYGKWHLAGGGHESHCYDESDGDTGNEQAFKFTDPNPVDLFGMAERAEKFMAKNQRAGKPFYIQLSWNALHAHGNALKATKAKYEHLQGGDGKQYETAPITEDLDTAVGRVMNAVDRLGLAGTTFVLYTSDNGSGGGKRNGGLNGGKGGVWEGGIRVPFIVRGPGVKPNAWCHAPIVGYDFLPTFCEWAGAASKSLPPGVDGGSFARLIADGGIGAVVRPRAELVFHFPHYQSEDGPQSAILVGDLKLMHFYEDDCDALFDLAADVSERRDLAHARPTETAALRKRLNAHLAAVGAQFPTPNPNYDPSKPPPPVKKGGGQKKGDAKPKKGKS